MTLLFANMSIAYVRHGSFVNDFFLEEVSETENMCFIQILAPPPH